MPDHPDIAILKDRIFREKPVQKYKCTCTILIQKMLVTDVVTGKYIEEA